jgi:hypothetical protein
MKQLLVIFAAVSMGLFSTPAHARTDKELVRDIIESQGELIYDRYHRGIDLRFDPKPGEINAYATFNEDDLEQPQITIYDELLRVMDQDEIVIVVCHEIGHHLGHMKFKELGQRMAPWDEMSVEGEADYFAGQCAKRFFQGEGEADPTDRIIAAARNAFTTLAEERLPPAVETGPGFPGVNDTYPDMVCRMISVEHGARGYRRPECWYNPKDEYRRFGGF